MKVLMTGMLAGVLAAGSFARPAAAQGVETELPGVTANVLELRSAGGVLRLAVRFTNGTATAAESNRFIGERITLVNAKSKRKYFPLKDGTGQYLVGPLADTLDGGRIAIRVPAKSSTIVWAYFEPQPAGTVVNVEMPNVFPFDNVAVTEGAGSTFSPTSAKSTPGGAIATLVSARRADQVLNIRLRLAMESGGDADLGAYFQYRHVFLLDASGKRKYPLVKDTEGLFQAQPLTVKGEGGSFILDLGKTTLVSLTFPAPPDNVQSVDLLLPYFLPFESIRIEGLGGAAASGIAAEGRSLGLEGALKELKAEVTPTTIKIDLAADVLFDFDKATIKKDAEPSLSNLATVLKANPDAKVSIEGHTDGRGADAYNQALSEQRAASVKQWLVANGGVNGTNLTTRGWGKTKPVAYNAKPDGSDDPEGRAKNRRVEVVVRKGG